MMTVFVDTSALLILLDADNELHSCLTAQWQQFQQDGVALVTTNYILVETTAVCQRRLGMEAIRALLSDIAPVLTVEWITPSTHSDATTALLFANRRHLSLVDCTSFEVMRRLGLRTAFTVDQHFRELGYEVAP